MIDDTSAQTTFRLLCFGERPRLPLPVMRLGLPRGYRAEPNGPTYTSWEEASAAMGWCPDPPEFCRPRPAAVRAMTWEEAERHEMVADGQL